MTQTDQNKTDGKRSFWKTLPGISAAAAALLGAAASLITILISVGLIDPDSNDPPSVTALSNQSEAELTPFQHPLAGAFADPEDEPLTYSATLANGDPLPNWLRIDPSSGELRGRPQRGDAGDYVVRVQAADPAGATKATDFNLTIAAAAARKAKVSVTFKRIELNALKEWGNIGEIWLLLEVNGEKQRWPAENGGHKKKGFYQMKAGETKAIDETIEVTVAEGGRLEVFVKATEWDGGSAASNDPLGNVTSGFPVNGNLGVRNPHVVKSKNCPKGCFTIHYDIGRPRWLN